MSGGGVIADRASLGDLPAQHHDQFTTAFDPDMRRLVYAVRYLGKNLQEGHKTDPDTRGYVNLGAVWFVNHGKGRDTPLWSVAYPGRIENAPTDMWRKYNSKLTAGPNVVPALQAIAPGGKGWQDDPALISQRAALPLGMELPTGHPVIMLPFTTIDKQELAAFPSGGLCIAVHHGGESAGKYGSKVFDVDATGALDMQRWAREQSGRRVYRLPIPGTGAAPSFAFQPGANPLIFNPFGTVSPPAPGAPTLPPGGLAWQLGFDIDSQAGHGVVADSASSAGAPVDDATTTTGGSTVSKPPPGSIAGLMQGPAAAKAALPLATGKLKITFFGGFGTSSYEVPWDGSQATIDWLRAHGEQAGYAAGGRIVSVVPTVIPPPATVSPPTNQAGTPKTQTKEPPKEVLAVSSYRGFGPLDVGADGDVHEITRTPDGEAVNSLHLRETAIWRGDTGDAPAKFDRLKWKQTCPDGPFWLETYWRNDLNESHGWIEGRRTGLRKWQTSYYFSVPTPQIGDGPTGGSTTGGGGGGGGGGGDFSLTYNPGQPSTVGSSGGTTPNNGYSKLDFVATPLEVAFSTFIARPWSVSPGVTDARNSFTSLTAAQLKSYNTAPVGARLQAIANQTGYAYQLLGAPAASRYRVGVSDVGGFALSPSNQDVRSRLLGIKLPANTSNLAYFTFEQQAKLAFGDTTLGARPADGFEVFRSYDGTVKRLDLYETNSSGQPLVDSPAALSIDFVSHVATFFGVPVAGGATRTTPQGYINGFSLAYNASSPSAVDVSGSIARDTTDTYDITLAGPVSADYLSNGGPLKNDAFVFADTAITGGSTHGTVGGTAINFGVSNLSGDIRPFLNGRTLTGSMAVAARNAGTKLQQITGSGGSKFLTEVAVGDVIGNSTTGYGMVAQVDSDTVCWVLKEFSDLSSSTYSGQTFTCYENVCVQIGAIPSCRISEISKDGLHIYSPTIFNGGVEDGLSHNMIVGQPAAALPGTGAGALGWPWPNGTVNVQTTTWIYLWARRTVGGTTTLSWSTQRTTPYTPATLAGYSIWRRVGVLPIDYDNFVIPFTQSNLGPHRLYMFEGDNSSLYSPWKALDNAHGSTGAWTRLALQRAVPPTSKLAVVLGECVGRNAGAGTTELYLRAASVGAAGLQRPRRVIADAVNGFNDSEFLMPTDAAQCIDYVTVSAGLGDLSSVFVLGYYDVP